MAAETLAYMIEVSEELQRIAAISNHLVPTMASFLWWEPDTPSAIPRFFTFSSIVKWILITSLIKVNQHFS
jgi:hypothetical protein